MAEMGRPTKYDPKRNDEFLRMRARGDSIAKIAATWDVAISTIYEWKYKNPDFSDVFMRASAKFKAHYEDIARANFNNPKFNTNLFKFWMTNKAGWFEKVTDAPLELPDLGKNPPKKLVALLKEGRLSSQVFEQLINAFAKVNEMEKGDQFLEAMEVLKEVKKKGE